tara:strand:+ start:119 stop:691 length:573 start_codon:yes stop_codon:yes gene_type:complete
MTGFNANIANGLNRLAFSSLSNRTKGSTKPVFHKHTFDVRITPLGTDVAQLGSFNTADGSIVVLNCTMPGKQIATNEKVIWGPAYNIPYARVYSGDFEMTVMYEKSFHQYINSWMNLVMSSPGDRAAYYDNILGSIELRMYDQTRTSSTTYTLQDCFPITIGGIDLDAGSQNTYQTMTVSWSFREYTLGD